MKKVLLIILAISFYPFGCEAQVGCQDLEIESEKWNTERNAYIDQVDGFTKEVNRLKQVEADLTDANSGLSNQIDVKDAQIGSQANQITSLNGVVNERDVTISTLNLEVTKLKDDLATAEGETIYIERDSITVNGVDYKVTDIELIRPLQEIDTVTVTHCGATVDTDWYHHGGIDLPYPKDITFATAEYGMTRVKFNTKLTDTIKVQASYQLKRIRDYEKAWTFYEFIK